MKRYGDNDTSRAMIRYFFLRRNFGGFLVCALAAGTALETYAIVHYAKNASMDFLDPQYLGALLLLIGANMIFVPVLPLGVYGVHQLFHFTRKELYIHLMEYRDGKGIPEKIWKGMTLRRNRYLWK